MRRHERRAGHQNKRRASKSLLLVCLRAKPPNPSYVPSLEISYGSCVDGSVGARVVGPFSSLCLRPILCSQGLRNDDRRRGVGTYRHLKGGSEMLLKPIVVTSVLLLATSALAQTGSQSSQGSSSNAPGQQRQTKPSSPGASDLAPGHQPDKAGPSHSESAPGQQPRTTGSGTGSSSSSTTKR